MLVHHSKIATKRLTNSIDVKMRAGPDWIGPEDRETTPVINPSTGELITDVPVATEEDAQSALESAKRTQPACAALPPGGGAGYLMRMAKVVRPATKRLAGIISLEEGKPLRESHAE